MKETLRHREAFEFYYSLGSKRNCRKVAVEFQVSERSVYNWSKWLNWQCRVEERDMKNAKKIEKKTDDTIVEARTKYITIIRETLHKYESALQSGDIKINSVADLERLAKLEMDLREDEVAEEDKIINIIFDTAENED